MKNKLTEYYKNRDLSTGLTYGELKQRDEIKQQFNKQKKDALRTNISFLILGIIIGWIINWFT
ncbi:hypothetical protein DA01_06460 [Dehalococcoides mccartyi]|uniref:Uncharacterized protein n=1 Tax=Dehalococcoides mccartyi TaxID=61435 RepID=A0A0V8LXR8_9CHLR|nr:hypothetical protein [Dehalococcoides mccartyi]KSV16328.1 hypothetical protein DA01_06460 [Dehalococcoides mccartyi]